MSDIKRTIYEIKQTLKKAGLSEQDLESIFKEGYLRKSMNFIKGVSEELVDSFVYMSYTIKINDQYIKKVTAVPTTNKLGVIRCIFCPELPTAVTAWVPDQDNKGYDRAFILPLCHTHYQTTQIDYEPINKFVIEEIIPSRNNP